MRSLYAQRKPVVNAYLVRERDRRLAKDFRAVVLTVLALGGGLFGYTWIHLEVVDTGYQIDALESRLKELSRDERQLRLEASYLASPQQIERRAVEELAMQPPALEQVIFWEELP